MTECKGIMGRLFGHNYDAVYDEQQVPLTPHEMKGLEMMASWDVSDVMRSRIKSTYQGHVCNRCGNRVRRVERI
ncbi:MAG: hypothetical protein ACN6OP_26655 [Pseudomonadales bacterium]